MATTPHNITVDDTDPALIYSGVWTTNGTASEYNTTAHGTTQRGASVLFTFQGTSVAVFGTIGKDSPNSTYAIDGSTPWRFAAPKLTAPTYHQMFFQSQTLPDSVHTLLIANLGTGQLWVDYIVYQPSRPSSASSSLPPSTTLSLQPTFSSHTVSLTPSTVNTPTSTDSGVTSGTKKSSVPASAVAGGAIGALVIIFLLIFGLLYYRKRAKRLAGEKLLEKNNALGDPPESDEAGRGAPVTPFTAVYTSDGYGTSDTNMLPPGSAYPPLDHVYQSQPSTPVYYFSNHYSLRSGFNASSENITGDGTVSGHGAINEEGAQPDYISNPQSQHTGAKQHLLTSPDRLAVPEHRHSLESDESQTSLAYLSADRVAMNPSSPLPDALPDSPPIHTTLQRTGKGGFIVHNPEVRQHEDGGVRLDVSQSPSPGSEPNQVVDVPPVYKPNY